MKLLNPSLLAGRRLKNQKDSPSKEEVWEELEGLAKTAGYKSLHKIIQVKKEINPQYFIGEGKVIELKEWITRLNPALIIFDNNLSPSQNKNLEENLECKVIDREGLILDIFRKHAKTHEAKVQVELAQLIYTLPRLAKRWGHLSRQKGGIGLRDAGEKQIEIDRRLIRRRIDRLKKQLTEIEKERDTQRKRRRAQFIVSLVGYTNAGKSTLMNALTNSQQLVGDRLFATLDSTVRVMKGWPGPPILVSDTVGFIDNLPHHLIASFRSTLGEINLSGFLLKVIDCSHPVFENQIRVTRQVLEDLHLDQKAGLWVFNKTDLLDESKIEAIKRKFPEAILISAINPADVKKIKQHIIEAQKESNLLIG